MEKRTIRVPGKGEPKEMVNRSATLAIPERGELIRRIDLEQDHEKIYGELVAQAATKGITLCCWWVCDGAAAGQCNCSCEMAQCGCGDIAGAPGICQAGQQGPSAGNA